MRAKPTNLQIAGVALLIFSAILLGVGIHHMIAIGTCSSTGYSANYGPVPTCPSGTGAWFAFIFGGIIGGLAGALMAGSVALVFAGIFGAIGFGALSIVLDSSAHHSNKIFGAIFGACFALVGVAALIAVVGSAIGSLRRPASKPPPTRATPPAPASAFGAPDASSAFGDNGTAADPILTAYSASQQPRAAPPSQAGMTIAPSPAALIPGLQAAARAKGHDPVDELAKLSDLHKQGALTDQEFANAKAKLLGQM
jgi:predicted lipid-binding transport protein (Tim44 family)